MSSTDEKTKNLSSLLEQVDEQPREVLQAMLKNIIDQSLEGRELATKWFLTTAKDVQSEPVVLSNTTATVPVVHLSDENLEWRSVASSREPPNHDICIYCLEPFDISKNSSTSCKYHVYPDNVNPEFLLVETEDDVTFYNDEFRQAFPENFTYPCCGRDLTEEKCQVGWHQMADPTERPPKRTFQKEFRPV